MAQPTLSDDPAAMPPPSPSAQAGTQSRHQVPPGWYEDPRDLDNDHFRWWNGAGWTAWMSTSVEADPPPTGRFDFGAAAVAVAAPKATPRFGLMPRMVMGAMVVLLLAAVMIVAGWDDRTRLAMSTPPITESSAPPDFSLICEDTALNLGGQALTAQIPAGIETASGNVSGVFGQPQCRYRLPDESPGEGLINFGLIPSDPAPMEESLANYQRQAIASLYAKGPGTVLSARAEVYPGLPNAWHAVVAMQGPNLPTSDDLEIILVDLPEGQRAFILIVMTEDVTAADRARMEQLRAGIKINS